MPPRLPFSDQPIWSSCGAMDQLCLHQLAQWVFGRERGGLGVHMKPGLFPEHGTGREKFSDEENGYDSYGLPLNCLAFCGSANCVFTCTIA